MVGKRTIAVAAGVVVFLAIASLAVLRYADLASPLGGDAEAPGDRGPGGAGRGSRHRTGSRFLDFEDEEAGGWRGDAPVSDAALPPGSGRDPLAAARLRRDMDLRRSLENYKKQMVYPPNSRPLDGDQRQLLHPDLPRPARKPLAGPDRPRADREREAAHSFVFTSDRFSITGEEPLTSMLVVYEGEKGARRVPVRAVSGSVLTGTAGGEPERVPGTLRFNDEGRNGDEVAGDHVYSNRLAPAHTEIAGKGGRYFVEVAFETGDGAAGTGRLSFFYTPASNIPARFSGVFEERVEEGSLVISPELDVKLAGSFVIEANLFSSDENPIAHTRFEGYLEAGKRAVDLLFFGKILRDRRRAGPYLLRNLRGHRSLPGRSPDREMMPGWHQDYRTRDYELVRFSDAEWQSPEKSATIQMYEDLMKRGTR